jgi:uncharacterized protein (DUF1501 family)
MPQNRREFLKASAALGLLPGFLPASARAGDDPHFFLLISVPNPTGLDASYLFDSRPLAMTQAGVIQNYRGTDPAQWKGTNGVTTLATELTKPLEPFRSYFTVVNGVVMAVGFDGHDQNFNQLFTGDAFGGESFVPHLNPPQAGHFPLDGIQRGKIKAQLSNTDGTVPLTSLTGAALVKSLAGVPKLDSGTAFFSHLMSRFSALSGSSGSFSLGSAAMQTAFTQSPALAAMFSQLQLTPEDTIPSFVQMIAQVFKLGAARAAVLELGADLSTLDTHDVVSCSAQPKVIGDLVSQLALTLQSMSATPFDSSRSLLDVTTFLFSPEFSRTLKQYGKPVDATGTDHNPLGNSVLIGGKGIRGGQVIGASDYASATETLSPAHLATDPGKLKAIGRPFDFTQCVSRTDLPATWQTGDYLGFNSVINTLYSLFKVDSKHWRLIERNGLVAPTVSALLQ